MHDCASVIVCVCDFVSLIVYVIASVIVYVVVCVILCVKLKMCECDIKLVV